jgi:hypothetical protein
MTKSATEKINSNLISTSALTLYSYIQSGLDKKEFREPVILGKLIAYAIPRRATKYSQVAGWFIHYLAGQIIIEAYDKLLNDKRRPVVTGLLAGGVTGVIAALVWRTVLKIHPNPPDIDQPNFTRYLIIGHIIFGLAALKTLGPAKQ